MVIICCRALT